MFKGVIGRGDWRGECIEPKEASDNAGLEGPEEMPRFGLAGRLERGFGRDFEPFPLRSDSSNALHLKPFLYPPQGTPRFSHCKQVGFVSSHFSLFALQVTQPFLLLLCFGFVTPAVPATDWLAALVADVPVCECDFDLAGGICELSVSEGKGREDGKAEEDISNKCGCSAME